MASNPVVDAAAKSLNDLELAHFSDGLVMAAAMQDYAHASDGQAAAKKQAGIALIMKLQGQGHISSWAAANFRAYFDQPRSALLAAGIAKSPSIPTPQQNLDSIGQAVGRIDWGGFLSALSNGNTWLRVAEVVLGIVLIVAGIVKISPAAREAAALGKVAALL